MSSHFRCSPAQILINSFGFVESLFSQFLISYVSDCKSNLVLDALGAATDFGLKTMDGVNEFAKFIAVNKIECTWRCCKSSSDLTTALSSIRRVMPPQFPFLVIRLPKRSRMLRLLLAVLRASLALPCTTLSSSFRVATGTACTLKSCILPCATMVPQPLIGLRPVSFWWSCFP